MAHLPPALVRSGRVELWLEMKLPTPQARADILSDYLKQLPEELRQIEALRLVEATEGFTGSDLKRLVEDGKALYAYDKSRQTVLRPTTDYFLTAVEAVRENKERYAAAEAQASMRPPSSIGSLMHTFMTSRAMVGGSDGEDE